jgi:hypothetical protein
VSWLRLDDGFAEHPKLMDVSDRAFRLHVAALCFCARNLTDGELVDRSVRMVCALSSATKKHVAELVAAGLWVKRADGTFGVKDFLEYNPTAEKVKAERDAARVRMRRVRSVERSGERSPTPDPDPSKTKLQPEDQDLTFQPPEQTRARVAALVDGSLGSGNPDAAPVAVLHGPPRFGIDVLIDLLPSGEVAANTRRVLERKFSELPPHFVDLAREELLAADNVRSRVRYLNGIADRMILERGRRATPAAERDRWVGENFDHPDAAEVIDKHFVDADAIERQARHEHVERAAAAGATERSEAA